MLGMRGCKGLFLKKIYFFLHLYLPENQDDLWDLGKDDFGIFLLDYEVFMLFFFIKWDIFYGKEESEDNG